MATVKKNAKSWQIIENCVTPWVMIVSTLLRSITSAPFNWHTIRLSNLSDVFRVFLLPLSLSLNLSKWLLCHSYQWVRALGHKCRLGQSHRIILAKREYQQHHVIIINDSSCRYHLLNEFNLISLPSRLNANPLDATDWGRERRSWTLFRSVSEQSEWFNAQNSIDWSNHHHQKTKMRLETTRNETEQANVTFANPTRTQRWQT